MCASEAMSGIGELLSQIRQLLERAHSTAWTSEVVELEQKYSLGGQPGKEWVKEEVLDAIRYFYGGMGSFQDYVLTDASTRGLTQEEQIAATKELHSLLASLYQAVRRERSRQR